MISLREADLMAWLLPLLWPFMRALALFSAMPVLGTRTVPTRLRIALSAFMAFGAQGSLPAMPVVALDGPLAFALVAQQVLIGVTLGFAVRVAFAALEMGGEYLGLQMGLNFAGFFDPVSASQGTATARLFNTTVAWLFIVMNGHLLVVGALADSFHSFPVGPEPFAFLRATQPQQWGAEMFGTALWIALPLLAVLLFVNITMGIVTRVAPQINLFAVGFPITLSIGLLGLLMTLPMMQAPFTMVLDKLLTAFR